MSRGLQQNNSSTKLTQMRGFIQQFFWSSIMAANNLTICRNDLPLNTTAFATPHPVPYLLIFFVSYGSSVEHSQDGEISDNDAKKLRHMSPKSTDCY
jgi:hypothetical protein